MRFLIENVSFACVKYLHLMKGNTAYIAIEARLGYDAKLQNSKMMLGWNLLRARER